MRACIFFALSVYASLSLCLSPDLSPILYLLPARALMWVDVRTILIADVLSFFGQISLERGSSPEALGAFSTVQWFATPASGTRHVLLDQCLCDERGHPMVSFISADGLNQRLLFHTPTPI